MQVWNQNFFDTAVGVLRRSGSLPEACQKLKEQTGETVSKGALSKAFERFQACASDYLDPELKDRAHKEQARKAGTMAREARRKGLPVLPAAGVGTRTRVETPREQSVMQTKYAPDAAPKMPDFSALLAVVRKAKAPTIEQIADALNCSPKIARETVQAALTVGYDLVEQDGRVLLRDRTKEAPCNGIGPVSVRVAPDQDGYFRFAAISDTHFGNEKCAIKELQDFLDLAYQEGYHTVLHAGDMCDGMLSHFGFVFGLSDVGFDKQCEVALSAIKPRPGMNVYYVDGNHDQSAQKSMGITAGRLLENASKARGRTDLHYLDATQGRLVFGEGDQAVKVELAHPRVKPAYAKSYPVQKWIEAIPGGAKPHLLLLGHLHCVTSLCLRNIVAIQPGCFCWQTPYEQERGLHPTVGGYLIKVRRSADHIDVVMQFRTYWQPETEWTVA
jgi:predicted phosphodiesterase